MKKRLCILIALSILAMFLIPATVVYASPPITSNQQGITVILDGKYYQPAEFNNIQQQLNARGIYLYCTIDNGVEYAFSNLNDFCNKYSIQFDAFNKTFNPNTQQMTNQIMPTAITPGFAYNWININQGGNCFAIQESMTGNFSGQFLNSISSVYYASGGSTYWIAYALCDQPNQGGNWLVIFKGQEYDNLTQINPNWNDRAESYTFGHS
jgi:hypothetical protein